MATLQMYSDAVAARPPPRAVILGVATRAATAESHHGTAMFHVKRRAGLWHVSCACAEAGPGSGCRNHTPSKATTDSKQHSAADRRARHRRLPEPHPQRTSVLALLAAARSRACDTQDRTTVFIRATYTGAGAHPPG